MTTTKKPLRGMALPAIMAALGFSPLQPHAPAKWKSYGMRKLERAPNPERQAAAEAKRERKAARNLRNQGGL